MTRTRNRLFRAQISREGSRPMIRWVVASSVVSACAEIEFTLTDHSETFKIEDGNAYLASREIGGAELRAKVICCPHVLGARRFKNKTLVEVANLLANG